MGDHQEMATICIAYDDWQTATFIPNGVDGGGFRLLWRDGHPPRFEHRCDRGDRGVIRCAPALDDAHQVTMSGDRVTVHPSILCSDCGTHGFITDGRWRTAGGCPNGADCLASWCSPTHPVRPSRRADSGS